MHFAGSHRASNSGTIPKPVGHWAGIFPIWPFFEIGIPLYCAGECGSAGVERLAEKSATGGALSGSVLLPAVPGGTRLHG